jgi:hypothetical protein
MMKRFFYKISATWILAGQRRYVKAGICYIAPATPLTFTLESSLLDFSRIITLSNGFMRATFTAQKNRLHHRPQYYCFFSVKTILSAKKVENFVSSF